MYKDSREKSWWISRGITTYPKRDEVLNNRLIYTKFNNMNEIDGKVIQVLDWKDNLTVLTDEGKIYWLWKETDNSEFKWNEIDT